MDFPKSKVLLSDIQKNIEERGSNEEDEVVIPNVEKYWNNNFSTVVTYLSGINLNQYLDLFHEQGVDNDVFFSLTDEDLCDIGMQYEDGQKLLNSISNRGRHRRKFGECVTLSEEDAIAVLFNTYKHLRLIRAALTSTMVRIEQYSNHNSILSTYLTTAKVLALFCSEADIQAKLLDNQFNAILNQKPGNQKKQRRNYQMMFVSVIATLSAVIYWLRRK